MEQRHTILVVDDEPYVVKSVQDLLRLAYRVLGTTCVKDGISIMEQEEVHVVMTDQRMPEMSGVELLTRLRGEYPDAIRLLFTGYSDIRAVIEAINQGNVFRYITKPWEPEELQTVVRQACEQYELLVERKRLVAELRAKNSELESLVMQLKRSEQLKSAFMQVASHELRTPLTILLPLTRLARQQAGDSPVKELLDRISRSGRRLHYLVDQMTRVLQADTFEHTLNRRGVDLSVLLNTAADDVQPFVALRKQTLTAEVADLGSFKLDEEKIRDALNQILLNAIKFTPDGGRITVMARLGMDGGAEVQVADSGVGINGEDLPHIFESFFTGSDVRHHSTGTFEFGSKGLGLGLSLAKSFVEMHGGTIKVKSDAGHGCTFTVTLPRASAATGEVRASS